MTEIEVGKPIPLRVQLRDGRSGLKVVASLLDDVGKLLETARLFDAGAGLYFSNEIKMPDLPNVTAQIQVDGTDQNGDPYSKGIETFISKPKVKAPEKTISGELTQRVKLHQVIEGVLK
jgi:hypothetical protein